MKYEELREMLKRIEFNKTEPETLTKLVEVAQIKGEKAQTESKAILNWGSKGIKSVVIG